MSIVLIKPPSGEPVSVSDMYVQLGMVEPADVALDAAFTAKLTRAIAAARRICDTYTRTVYLTQTWLLQMDSFPRHDERYSSGWPHQILLPKLPFQSIEFMKYVDTDGNLQTLLQDTTHGQNPASLPYGFLLDNGSETQPARLRPLWAGPWPPTRRVPNAVQIQFKCGYGGPVLGATIAIDTAIVQGLVFLPGDVGQSVIVPGAGVEGVDLKTSILSIDINGQATLKDNVVIAIEPTISLWVGHPVPETIKQAILLQAEFLFSQGGDIDLPPPQIVRLLLDEHRNLVA